ncbi:MAG: hypothetical protein AAGC44_09310 [Planctomycetota bacterium]
MAYLFREIRLHDVSDALAFADAQGLSVTRDGLHHHLSLMVRDEGETVAVGLCCEQDPGRFAVRFATAVADAEQTKALANELADRVLRKLQAEGIGAARVTGADADCEATLWEQTNWLDRVKPVLPRSVRGRDTAEEKVGPSQENNAPITDDSSTQPQAA